MYARLTLALFLIVSLAALPGCWSRKELNELAVVMALGIDLHEEGYAVSAQVMNPSETGTQKGNPLGSSPIVTYRSVGKTIPDALQRMLSMAPRMLYLSHIRVLVFGEKLARRGVSDALDFISRSHQLRTDFFMLVAKNAEASDILEVVTPFEHVPAGSLYTSILISHRKWAATGKVTLQQFVTELERGGSNPVLSGVRLRGSLADGESVDDLKEVTPKTLIEHAGLAVFKRDRLVGWLGEPASKAVNYLLNDVESTAGFVACPEGGVVGYAVSRAKSKIDVATGKDGKPEFTVKLKVEGDLNAVQCTIDLHQPSSVEEIEKRLELKLSGNVEHYIEEAQKRYGSDIFGFGEALHRQNPKAWKQYRDDWDERFKSVKIGVSADVKVRRTGSIVQPLKREMNKR
ncbi:Ger(x)C family spore germination protein [Cohnella algarum]|uniref:Ger(x)C family spore germination protein n=1 Tax=Cohnella algarum TaxID=2044859 RepID=UPI001966E66D|nr:Ger(x)C family spore germination protein [Cohnella algarum]MBN2983960.1 Ger(x)C family spore germination protein [Cohnella algarum]